MEGTVCVVFGVCVVGWGVGWGRGKSSRLSEFEWMSADSSRR